MNIGITVYPTYGGSGIVGSELGRDLAERGHNVHFISSFLPTRLTELNERIHFHEVEMMSYPLFEHVKNGLVEPRDAYMKAVDKGSFETMLTRAGLSL